MVDGEVESVVGSFDSEIELDENYDKRLDAFNEMHEEAKKLSQANNFLKGKLRCHVDKIVSC